MFSAPLHKLSKQSLHDLLFVELKDAKARKPERIFQTGVCGVDRRQDVGAGAGKGSPIRELREPVL